MRVNPNFVSNVVGSLNQVSANEQTLTEELSSGVTVNSLSDNPAAAGENVLLTSQLNADDTFSQTASSAESMLQVSDSVLGNVVTQLTSAVSLATSAANGTLSGSNEQSVAEQLTGVRDELLSLANSSYLGQYIFGGSQGGSAPFSIDSSTSPATVTYSGDSNVSYVETPSGQKIQTNLPGNQIFTSAGNDVFATLNGLIADLTGGAGAASASADVSSLTNALNYVSQQRVTLDDSITRLTAAGNYNSSESVQLASAQNALIQTNTAQVASQLSSAETQQSALTQVIAAIDQQGTLFNVLQ